MVQSEGRKSLPKHVIAIPTFYVMIFAIEVHNLQVHK